MECSRRERKWRICEIKALRRVRRAAANLWAAPPPIFDDRRATAAADNLSARRRCHVGVLNYFVAFFMLCMILLKMVPQCKIDFFRQQFVPMSGLQNLTLNIKRLLKSPNSSNSENFRSIDFDF